jgi:hypothetical protein
MPHPPEKSDAGRTKAAAREARLAAALKRNLGRRKNQAREKAEDEAPPPPALLPLPAGERE